MASFFKAGQDVCCPGCGLTCPATGAPLPGGLNASAECFERYGELAAYTLTLADPAFPHQHAVDAYAAQHAGATSKPIATFFALAGLYLACEHGLSGRAVQSAHMVLAKRKRDWPRLPAPAQTGAMTVSSVLAAPSGAARMEALRRWATSVWHVWRDQHGLIRSLVAEWLPGPPERFERADQRGR
jgi:hypothetical protein